ncbi:MAG: NAD(P)/FAD-dependent oxidoreductase [Alphaproteobacteria bacterium]|nr:NAD(P)/FAD-dependent oxidoreductase [Rickettsiales bacterium]
MSNFSSNSKVYDVAIIGAGPAGLFAITACGMAGMKSVCIENLPLVGGQCATLYPEKTMYGIPCLINVTGDEFVGLLAEQANEFSPKFLLSSELKSITKEKNGDFKLMTSTADVFAKTIIIASGKGMFTPNKVPLEGIEKFEDKSVFYIIKNKSLFKDKSVCIAGGGDSAIDWCIELVGVAKNITLVHRRNKFRCSQYNQDKLTKLAQDGLINIKTPFQLHAVSGSEDGYMKSIDIISLDDKVETIQADCLLPFFGLANRASTFDIKEVNIEDGRILVNSRTMESDASKIFAIGDTCKYESKLFLIINGFYEAMQAADKISKYINPNGGKGLQR